MGSAKRCKDAAARCRSSVGDPSLGEKAKRSGAPSRRPGANLRCLRHRRAGLNNRIPRLQPLSPAEKKQAAPAPRADLSRVLPPISARRNPLSDRGYTRGRGLPSAFRHITLVRLRSKQLSQVYRQKSDLRSFWVRASLAGGPRKADGALRSKESDNWS